MTPARTSAAISTLRLKTRSEVRGPRNSAAYYAACLLRITGKSTQDSYVHDVFSNALNAASYAHLPIRRNTLRYWRPTSCPLPPYVPFAITGKSTSLHRLATAHHRQVMADCAHSFNKILMCRSHGCAATACAATRFSRVDSALASSKSLLQSSGGLPLSNIFLKTR
jgi:hypothetical protein